MSNKTITVNYLKDLIVKAAKQADVHPSTVTVGMLKELDESITEWKLREFGGISGLKKYFPMTNKDLVEIKRQKDLQGYINKLEKQVAEKMLVKEEILKSMESALKSLKIEKQKIPSKKKSTHKTKMTMELMVSDVHYGKKSQTFDLQTCRNRMQELSKVFLEEVDQKEKSFDVETIIIALIGDIIESATMHGEESMRSSEFGNARQIQESIDSLFNDIILPIAKTGKKVIIPAVTGNHDRTDKNRTYNDPGENNVTWIIYKALERYCQLAGLNNVSFAIPRDSYTIVNVYGSNILYEHGDNVKNLNKQTIYSWMEKRGRQVKKQIDMIRMGHYHEYLMYDRGRVIVNESVCGEDSYSKVNGYASTAGQTINFYVNTNKRPSSFYYSFPVYLGG